MYHLNEQGDSTDEPSPTVFGDLRPKLDSEYVVDVIPPGSGGVEAIVGVGSHRSASLVRSRPSCLEPDILFRAASNI